MTDTTGKSTNSRTPFPVCTPPRELTLNEEIRLLEAQQRFVDSHLRAHFLTCIATAHRLGLITYRDSLIDFFNRQWPDRPFV